MTEQAMAGTPEHRAAFVSSFVQLLARDVENPTEKVGIAALTPGAYDANEGGNSSKLHT